MQQIYYNNLTEADNRITLYKQQISHLEAGKSQGKYPKHSSLIKY